MDDSKKEVTTETPGKKGDIAGSIFDEAQKVAERIEAANKRAEELLARQEALLARQILSGKSNAGEIKKPEVLSDVDMAKKLLRGELSPFD